MRDVYNLLSEVSRQVIHKFLAVVNILLSDIMLNVPFNPVIQCVIQFLFFLKVLQQF